MAIQDIIRYVQVTIIVALLFFIPFLCMRYIYLKRKNEWPIKDVNREMAVLGFVFYMMCLFQITALRFGGIGWDLESMMARETRVNVIPIAVLWNWVVKGRWWHLFYNAVGNLIWFLPFGILVPALFRSQRRFYKTVFVAIITSFSIESLQYILCTGVSDIDDIILNAIGAGVGYIMFKIIYAIYISVRGKKER